MKNVLFVLSLLLSLVLFLSSYNLKLREPRFHSEEEIEMFQHRTQTPIGPGQYFQPSSSCRGCHGFDTLGLANVDENGMDVNLHDHWEATMMANSARDPLWRAKVSQEILVNPAHANALQSKCTACHAPMGHYTAFFHGATSYTIADLVNDSLGLNGVACAACHTIDPTVGSTFSGVIPYDTMRQVYGPFTNPFFGPMQLYEGYTPMYSPHMDESRVCSSCHTLITETADLNGNSTGGEFVEQATYHEYLNSSFPANNKKCQTCHMPQLSDPIIIANGYISLQPRFPFNQHIFAGANSFMLTMIKNNKSSLGIVTEDYKFDSTLAATSRLLRDSTVEFNIQLDSIVSDTGYFRVKLRNKAGHKFPSGYPSRRAVLQVLLTDANGDTVFRSGTFTNDYRVQGEVPQFEPHHDIIDQSDKPQIYELVMGDVNGNFTSVLERASILLKDNRIPPDGFTTTAPMYDTVKISNDALNDPNFNKLNSIEGTGIDYVYYHIPLQGTTGIVKVNAALYYQSVPPKWLDEMFTLSSAAIDTFQNMYNNADKTPFLVASDSLTNININTGIADAGAEDLQVIVSPTLTSDGIITVTCNKNYYLKSIEVFDGDGKKVVGVTNNSRLQKLQFRLPEEKGAYFIRIEASGKTTYRKVLRM